MNIMIDIETLSTKGNALVLSIAARKFYCTDDGPRYGDSLVMVPSLVEQILLGRHIDRSTQLWWGKQSEEASLHWRVPEGETKRSVGMALRELTTFLHDATAVWARGPQFDVSILNSLATDVGLGEICSYNSVRDQRTYCETAPNDGKVPAVSGTAHEPLYDCDLQIAQMWACGFRTPLPPLPDAAPAEA